MIPNTELAEVAGLACDNGIVVDNYSRTEDVHIYAAGDCTSYRHPFAGKPIRLESVQNANDQGKAAAASIAGKPKPYETVPWCWSTQYDVKLQMTGLQDGCDETVLRGDIEQSKFALFHFREGDLRAVDAVNRPSDYIVSRKLLAAGILPSREQVEDDKFNLKNLIS